MTILSSRRIVIAMAPSQFSNCAANIEQNKAYRSSRRSVPIDLRQWHPDLAKSGRPPNPGLRWTYACCFVFLAIVTSGCFRPPGEHILGVKNDCRSPVSAKVSWSYILKGHEKRGSKLVTDLPPGQIEDVSLWGEGRGSQIAVVASGASSAGGTWPATSFPQELLGPNPEAGYAILEVHQSRVELRDEALSERMSGTPLGLFIYASLAALVLVLGATALVIRKMLKRRVISRDGG